MSVVQRCPSCGTTGATAGECEACHDALVRYFCTNHTPGLWLDESTCPTCGAQFGESTREASAPVPDMPVRTRSAKPAPAIARRRPAPATAPPSTRVAPPSAWGGRKLSPSADAEELAPGASRIALLQQILRAVVRARYMPARAARYRERSPIERAAGGCAKRLLLVMMLLVLAVGGGAFLVGRALLAY